MPRDGPGKRKFEIRASQERLEAGRGRIYSLEGCVDLWRQEAHLEFRTALGHWWGWVSSVLQATRTKRSHTEAWQWLVSGPSKNKLVLKDSSEVWICFYAVAWAPSSSSGWFEIVRIAK